MRSPLLLLSVLSAALMMTACATPPRPVIVQQKPLPAALAVSCPPPVAMNDNSADAALLTLKQLYDQYGLCAGRLVELVNYLETRGPDDP